MWVDDPLELLIAALERHRRDPVIMSQARLPTMWAPGDLAGAGVDD